MLSVETFPSSSVTRSSTRTQCIAIVLAQPYTFDRQVQA